MTGDVQESSNTNIKKKNLLGGERLPKTDWKESFEINDFDDYGISILSRNLGESPGLASMIDNIPEHTQAVELILDLISTHSLYLSKAFQIPLQEINLSINSDDVVKDYLAINKENGTSEISIPNEKMRQLLNQAFEIIDLYQKRVSDYSLRYPNMSEKVRIGKIEADFASLFKALGIQLLSMLSSLAHEFYHLRQKMHAPEYHKRTLMNNKDVSRLAKGIRSSVQGNKQLELMKKVASIYLNDTGEKSARAVSLTYPVKYLKKLQNDKTNRELSFLEKCMLLAKDEFADIQLNDIKYHLTEDASSDYAIHELNK